MANSDSRCPSSSSSAEKPRPAGSSRTSSFEQFQPNNLFQKNNSIPQSDPAQATLSVGPPNSEDLSAGTRKCHSLITQHAPSLNLIHNLPTPGMHRRSSLREPSGGLATSKRSSSCSSTMRNSTRAPTVKRWAGLSRTTREWDGLRRDPDLWFEDGDCYVHLYARGQSRRGPSFRIPFRALRHLKCGAMFSLCFAQIMPSGPSSHAAKRISSGFNTPVSSNSTIELFVPAPDGASREAAFQWHLTTRNFFAFVLGRPLVGAHLGQSFVDLQERMQLFRSGQIDNRQDFLAYAEAQGYCDFVDCADYALGMLYYAEHYKIRDLWIDAFTHCVGMNESLALSQELDRISKLTKALITRAYLEMDIHLGRVTAALRTFLEDDFSPANLGLANGARAHLDRFRSFLHSFYVEKYGYWPPPRGSPFSKVLYKSLYLDFKNLHDYLVDLGSTTDLLSQKPASGGICVLQNVMLFDKRHSFAPLPHPLPLLPQHDDWDRKTPSQKALMTLALASKQSKTDRYLTAHATLAAATNVTEPIATSAIVQAYMRFERQCVAKHQREEKVTIADARKVRWLLIYGTLQYLISAVQAPKEVRDPESPEYPLCCLVTESSPWQSASRAVDSCGGSTSQNAKDKMGGNPDSCLTDQPASWEISGAMTIKPDCQSDDYFTHTNPNATATSSRPVSVEVPAPLRVSSGVARNTSARSLRNLSLPGRGSRRNSLASTNSQPYCEIIVHGFGNGLNPAIVDPPSRPMSRGQSLDRSQRASRSAGPEESGLGTSWLRSGTSETRGRSKRPIALDLNCSAVPVQTRTPVLESFQVDQLVNPFVSAELNEPRDSSESATSRDSPFWSDGASSASSKSSATGECVPLERRCSSAEVSGLLGGLVSVDASPVTTPDETPSKTRTPAPRPHNDGFRFSFHSNEQKDRDSESPVGSTSLVHGSSIGIALAGPKARINPPKPPVPNQLLGVEIKYGRRPKAMSKATSSDQVTTPTPLQMQPPTPPTRTSSLLSSKTENLRDIFTTKSRPSRQHTERSQGQSTKLDIDRDRAALHAIPPPIKKAPQIDMVEVVGRLEKARKKEKRKSFWRH
ncbi:hypothetical protein BU24DRAFT_27597 [Aaosphaeria arxii CBS 175.79]|uniref:DUF8004 domain-containing protein n=1 Tax=Aaosphaeria arxii CBS 175.79 TaxID=1450172 RepID=A0A6A5Y9Q6_9PLEO|nr:uncharacterized protein BU24DRAFT_27597 [Aaosphaeria arxii CBS 175.79]KAF2021747.1 hypothetical protein BU24DRAFT_27597 [Aaosphaeria arxii CBS 175.79]